MKAKGEFQLYVLLSDRCNFACRHCLNSSGPKAARWLLSANEVDLLASTINGEKGVKTVHFTGGEPTLFSELIADLRSKIHRQVSYEITTNAHLGRELGAWAKGHGITRAVISFDRFHEPFISKERAKEAIQSCLRHNIVVELNVVFETLADLVGIEELRLPGVGVQTCTLIASGRSKESGLSIGNERKAWGGTCPSLEESREKVIYMPGQGFTSCCGPLVFERQVPDASIFAESLPKHTLSNSLRASLLTEPMSAVAGRLGLSREFRQAIATRCDACRVLRAPLNADWEETPLTLSNMALEDTSYIRSNRSWDEKRMLEIRRFQFSHFLVRKPGLPIPASNEQPSGLAWAFLQAGEENLVGSFIKGNYYDAFSSRYSEEEVGATIGAIPEYLANSTSKAVLYRKEGQLVGLLLWNDFEPHPHLQRSSRHIGYWGRERARLTREESAWIKAHWLGLLTNNGKLETPLDCSIGLHNIASLYFAEKMGFRRHSMRIDPRPEGAMRTTS